MLQHQLKTIILKLDSKSRTELLYIYHYRYLSITEYLLSSVLTYKDQ